MSDYHQPDFYRFNQDSLQLVKFVSSVVHSAERILDLGAGSGVIGIEIARGLEPKHLTLVEVQEEYRFFLKKNIEEFLPEKIQNELVITSFGKFHSESKWDLIVCNPPYYFPDSGQASPDHRRNTARSFIIDGWEILLGTIQKYLADEGKAFIVLKNDKKVRERITALIPKALNGEWTEWEDLFFLTLSRLDKN